MAITKNEIKARAERLGFSFIGFSAAQATPHISDYLARLHEYEQGDLSFLSRSYAVEGRKDPKRLLKNTRSVIVMGVRYPPPQRKGLDKKNAFGTIAAYAMVPDYHTLVKEKARLLIHELQEEWETSFHARIFVDSGPVMEKDMAFSAGLVGIGKNTLCIHPDFGSFFFICCILTDLDLEPGECFDRDLCGDCRKCEKACPTGCIHDYRIDAMRCISYLTIEHRGVIPREMRKLIGSQVFGCDLCQNVCPYNENAKTPDTGYFFNLTPIIQSPPDICEHLQLTPDAFNHKFLGTPVHRIGFEQYMRNIIIVAGNSSNGNCIPFLKHWVCTGSELISRHAAWALSSFQNDEIRNFLIYLLDKKINKGLKEEILELIT